MDNISFTELGIFLRQKRIQRKLTQVQVAKELDYSSQFVANWERGVSSPPLEALRKIVEIYKISPKEFYSVMTAIHLDFFKRSIFSKKTK
ncbi:MAG: helix-turn-helix transcriptional regulator [Bdellovibrionota bacterium]